MKNKTRYVLGISGGKDSAALAIYLNDKLKLWYVFVNMEGFYQYLCLPRYLGLFSFPLVKKSYLDLQTKKELYCEGLFV